MTGVRLRLPAAQKTAARNMLLLASEAAALDRRPELLSCLIMLQRTMSSDFLHTMVLNA